MLADKDRIFTNLYGIQDWGLKGARARGAWDGTKRILERGRDALVTAVQEMGRMVGVDTPYIDAVLALVQQRAREAGCYGN